MNVSSNRKITEVENKKSGINIIPAPRAFGFRWLLLSVGTSKNIGFLRNFNAQLNNAEVSGYKAKIIIKLIIN